MLSPRQSCSPGPLAVALAVAVVASELTLGATAYGGLAAARWLGGLARSKASRKIYETDSATASAANRAQAGGGARPGGAPDRSAATRASTVGCVRSQRDGPSSLLKYACA